MDHRPKRIKLNTMIAELRVAAAEQAGLELRLTKSKWAEIWRAHEPAQDVMEALP